MPIIDAAARARITEAGKAIREPIRLSLKRTPDKRSDIMKIYCDELKECIPGLEIVEAFGESDELPMIAFENGVRYHGLPVGTELSPFLELLSGKFFGSEVLSDTTKEALKGVMAPAEIKVFVSEHCPHCPNAVRKLFPLPFNNSFVTISVIDGGLFPELAEKDGVSSAPTAIVGSGYRWSGNIPLNEILGIIAVDDPVLLSEESLMGLIQEGKAGNIARMIIEGGKMIPAFIDTLTHEHFSVRLGAMAAMEEIADEKPDLAEAIVPALMKRFPGRNRSVQGDIIYLIGESGGKDALPFLSTLLEDTDDPEIRETVLEAMENINRS